MSKLKTFIKNKLTTYAHPKGQSSDLKPKDPVK